MVPKTQSLPHGWNLHSNGEHGGGITVVKSAINALPWWSSDQDSAQVTRSRMLKLKPGTAKEIHI